MHEYKNIAVEGLIFENKQHICEKCNGVTRTGVMSMGARVHSQTKAISKVYCIECAVKTGSLHPYYGKVAKRVINEAILMYRALRLKSIMQGEFRIGKPNYYLQGIYSVDVSNIGITRQANRTNHLVLFNAYREKMLEREYSELEMNVIHGVIETMLHTDKFFTDKGEVFEIGCPKCYEIMTLKKVGEHTGNPQNVLMCTNGKCSENLKAKITYVLTQQGLEQRKLGV